MLVSAAPLIDYGEYWYMRNDQWTVNGYTKYGLNGTQTSSVITIALALGEESETWYLGFRLWVVHSDHSQVEVTSGTAVSIASGSTGGLKTGVVYHCPDTDMEPTDALLLTVYAKPSSPPNVIIATFITKQLSFDSLDACDLYGFYYLYRNGSIHNYNYYFKFGISTYDSKVAGWLYTPYVPSGTTENFYGNIPLTFAFTSSTSFALNQHSTIPISFLIKSQSQWQLHLTATIPLNFVLNGIATTAREISMHGTIALSLGFTALKTFSMSVYGQIPLLFSLESTSKFITTTINFYGTIPLNFLLNSIVTVRTTTINIPVLFIGLAFFFGLVALILFKKE
jgi:hypothetical protein